MPSRNIVRPTLIALRFAILSAIILLLMPLVPVLAVPTMPLFPTERPIENAVDVEGSDFVVMSTVVLTLDREPLSSVPETIVVDGLGNSEAGYQLPNSEAGTTLVATDIFLDGKNDDDHDDEERADDDDRGEHRDDDGKDDDHKGRDHHDNGSDDDDKGQGHDDKQSDPVAHPQAITTDEDTSINVILDGGDRDGDAISYSIVDGPLFGELGELDPLRGAVSYDPSRDYFGQDIFTFKVNDGRTNSSPASVTIDVIAINDPPIASDGEIRTREEVPISFSLTAYDADNDILTYVITSVSVHGSITGTAPNLQYTPRNNFDGSDSITFNVNDGTSESNTATILITVRPEKEERERRTSDVNDEPVEIITVSQMADNTVMMEEAVDEPPYSFPVVLDPLLVSGTQNDDNVAASQSPAVPEITTELAADILAPRLSLPTSPLQVLASTWSGAVVTYSVHAVDQQDGEIEPSCSPGSGSSFPVGRVNVLCKATDAAGNVALESFTVVIRQSSTSGDAAFSSSIPILVAGVFAAAAYGGFRAVKRTKSK